ncbi:MAG: hypothetical protein GY786_01500 [Proteobacteria bacterium]|nr:hypothetical protein [Pseudomonadota bacterium]
MYKTDQLEGARSSSLNRDLLRDVVFTPGLRPTLSKKSVESFECKRQRRFPGYSPSSPLELLDWVKERLLLPESEWSDILECMKRDHQLEQDECLTAISNKIVCLSIQQVKEAMILARELVADLVGVFYDTGDIKECQTLDGAPVAFETNVENREEKRVKFIAEWIQFYGPVSLEFVSSTLGMDEVQTRILLDDLLETRQLIEGVLLKDDPSPLYCDAENFESLLRIKRSASTPVFEPLEITHLQLFLATIQGLNRKEGGHQHLTQYLDQLIAYQASAVTWESDLFPARMVDYNSSWLDSLMQEEDLVWLGADKQKLSFFGSGDLGVLTELSRENPDRSDLDEIFSDPLGHYDFSTLQRKSGIKNSRLEQLLWQHVWIGEVSNDSFHPVRKGALNQFKFANEKEPIAITDKPLHGNRGRRGSRRLAGGSSSSGNWYLPFYENTDKDLLETEELNKEKVRLLLDRYGILFRELLMRESPQLQWKIVFRSLRLMELSGEILAGCFFKEIGGLQFISHQAFRRLQIQLPEKKIYWINALDPASCCGLPLDGLKGKLPKRVGGNYLVYQGSTELIRIQKNGGEIQFNIETGDPLFQESLACFHHLLNRSFMPKKGISIERINHQKSTKSPYLDALKVQFDLLMEPNRVTLYKKRV